jgi:hypothetical protein
MFRIFHALLCCVGLVGCGSADKLSAREADRTFDAITQVAADVIGVTRDAVEHGARGLKVQSDGPNFDISGDLGKGTDWDGIVDISGTATRHKNDYDYELAVVFDQVTDEEQETTIDGEVSLVFYADDVDIDLVFAVGVAVDGDLDVIGKAEGHAEIRYDLEFSMNGFDIDLTAEGEISGHDVSGFPKDLTITL